jgi:predicted Zn-dependent protease
MRLLAKAADSQDMVRLEFRTPAGSRVNMVRFKDVVKYPVLPTQDDIVNAFADGDKVYIASGMMRFAESDEELALVVGHEIAHNCLGHISKQKGNMLLGGLLDAVVYAGTGVDTGNVFASAGGQAFSQSFESEADYMGIYLAKRAGYDVEHAPAFWRRMAAEHPGSIKQNFGSSHPSTPERFLALEATVKEIDAKTAARLPLVPDPKGVEAD